MDSDTKKPAQLLPCNNLDPIGGHGYDGRNTELPSTPGVGLPLAENLANTLRTETSQGPADSDCLGQELATIGPQNLETAAQSAEGRLVTSAPEEPVALAGVESANGQLRRSEGVTGDSNTKDAEPSAQPMEGPADSSLGRLTTNQQAPGPTPGEHPEALADPTTHQADTPMETLVEAQTARPAYDGYPLMLGGSSEAPSAGATTQGADTSVKAQAETQSSSPSHESRLEELETREASEQAGDHLKVQHQPSDIAPKPVSPQPSRQDRTQEPMSGSAAGVKLSMTTRMTLMRGKTAPSRSTTLRPILRSARLESDASRTMQRRKRHQLGKSFARVL